PSEPAVPEKHPLVFSDKAKVTARRPPPLLGSLPARHPPQVERYTCCPSDFEEWSRFGPAFPTVRYTPELNYNPAGSAEQVGLARKLQVARLFLVLAPTKRAIDQ